MYLYWGPDQLQSCSAASKQVFCGKPKLQDGSVRSHWLGFWFGLWLISLHLLSGSWNSALFQIRLLPFFAALGKDLWIFLCGLCHECGRKHSDFGWGFKCMTTWFPLATKQSSPISLYQITVSVQLDVEVDIEEQHICECGCFAVLCLCNLCMCP